LRDGGTADAIIGEFGQSWSINSRKAVLACGNSLNISRLVEFDQYQREAIKNAEMIEEYAERGVKSTQVMGNEMVKCNRRNQGSISEILGHQLNPRSVAWAQRNERSKVINVSRSE
jgi:hypothetical protein